MQRVLVVDDSHVMHTFMRYTLRSRRDVEVEFARDGKEALDIVLAGAAPLVVLLDINMPVLNGLEFLQRITEAGLGGCFKVVIVSTEGREEDVLRGLGAGACAYLRKPFTAKDLHRVLDGLLVAPA